MLETLDQVLISIRGKNKYVVVDMNRYNYLRELENGRSRVLTSAQHFEELDNTLRD